MDLYEEALYAQAVRERQRRVAMQREIELRKQRQIEAMMQRMAIESAMRRGEIFGMTWGDVHKNHVHLPVTKTDDPRDVPLSPIMRELLACLSSFDKHDKKDNLFVINVESFKSAFDRASAKAGVKDLQFRDTRHEAISRFVRVQKLSVEHVAKITGHKKIETLLNVYYNPTADELYDAMYGDK